jgi:crotonobetainyl-CoA:carnitine CoA-transferase CaiB-like acyl-CoA transferase
MVAANADAIWVRLTEAMGRPELADDPSFATHAARGHRAAEVDRLVAEWTVSLSYDELDAALTHAGVPHGLIYRAPDILEDEHYLARDSVVRVFDDALDRDVPMPSVFPRLSRTPGHVRWAGAAVGAHTDEVLADLEISERQEPTER